MELCSIQIYEHAYLISVQCLFQQVITHSQNILQYIQEMLTSMTFSCSQIIGTHLTKLLAVVDTRPIYHVTEQIHNSSPVNSLWIFPHQVS